MNGILNWRRVTEKVTTSGQPTEAQFETLAEKGIETVVNLGPHDNNGALADEPSTLKGLGLEYHYIPVDFDAPSDEDFEAFCEVMQSVHGKTIHVHCIYNARVSAFFYRFAREGYGGDVDEAFNRMDSIWRPGGIWATFIGKPEDVGQPNRYAGLDY